MATTFSWFDEEGNPLGVSGPSYLILGGSVFPALPVRSGRDAWVEMNEQVTSDRPLGLGSFSDLVLTAGVFE